MPPREATQIANSPEMQSSIGQAKKELDRAVEAELKRVWAESIEIERAALEGRTLPELSEGVFRISERSLTKLAYLIRAGYLNPEDVSGDGVDGDRKGIKRLWPAYEADAPVAKESVGSPPASPAKGSETVPPSASDASPTKKTKKTKKTKRAKKTKKAKKTKNQTRRRGPKPGEVRRYNSADRKL